MARKKVEEFKPRGIKGWLDGRRHYNSEQMREVMAAAVPDLTYEAEDTGPASTCPYAVLYVRVKNSLDQYALTYEIRRTEQERPTLNTMAKEFRQIEAAAYRLLEALHVTSKSQDLPEEVRRGPGDMARQQEDLAAGFAKGFPGYPTTAVSRHIEANQTIRSAVKGVVALAELAGRAAADREHLTSGSSEPRRGKDAAEDNFVAGLMHTWKGCFGRVDVTTQAFRRFAYAAMKVVDPEVPEHSIRGRVVRLLQTEDFIGFQSPSTN
mgnify:CR=1 FL=1